MRNGTDLLGRARSVSSRLREHKRAVREHRQAAQEAAAELDEIKAECARRGIAFTAVPVPGSGRGPSDGRA